MKNEVMREAFEDAALAYAIEREAAGMTRNPNGAPMTKESLFWRQPDGTYGVLMFNAAWWGWQQGVTLEREECAKIADSGGAPKGENFGDWDADIGSAIRARGAL